MGAALLPSIFGSKDKQPLSTPKVPVSQGQNNIDLKEQVKNDPGLTDIMTKLANGQMSYKDALAAAQGGQYANPSQGSTKAISFSSPLINNGQTMTGNVPNTDYDPTLNARLGKAAGDQLFTDPRTGSLIAQQQVLEDPLSRGLFNEGGLKDQAIGQYGKASGYLDDDRSALMGRDGSYGLNDTDLAAYGQGSANIARMFGSQENNLAQSLTDRGFGAAGSGVAGAAFSGLQGNKNEQLAGLQMQIAQSRIQTAQGLAQARTNADLTRQAQAGSLSNSLGLLGAQQEQNQYARNTGGLEHDYNSSMGSNNMNLSNWAAQQNSDNERLAAENQGSSANPLGTAIGTAIGGAGGAYLGGPSGAMAGANMGGSIGNAVGGSPKYRIM